MAVVVQVQSEAHLAELVLTLHPPRCGANRLYGGQQERCQDAQNGDCDQKLDQSEAGRLRQSCRFGTLRSGGMASVHLLLPLQTPM
jgi:hypothetical protein